MSRDGSPRGDDERGPAIQVSDVTKVYERYSHRKQFRTLKSALLGGTLLSSLKPDERFPALTGVTFNVRRGSTFAIIGRNGVFRWRSSRRRSGSV